MAGYDPTSDDFIEIEATAVAVTAKAVCLDYNGDEQWVPRSQTDIDPSDPIAKGDVLSVGIKKWLLKQKGWAE